MAPSPSTSTPSSSSSPPSLQQATVKSTVAWQRDLESLFVLAKDRFPDVVWDLVDEDDDAKGEEVWGHKAIVYARAPPTFQQRYFSFRPAPISSPGPYSPTGFPAQSALSLSLGVDLPSMSRSPSPFRPVSPSPSTTVNGVLRLTTTINPILFSKELEYLYTGKGFGEAFEFLFDSTEHRDEGDAEENRIDKLRKDMVFMWRSRLYSDVRITIEGRPSSTHENTAAVFSTHRFILVSRSTYFHNALIAWGNPSSKPGEPASLTLPSPPFTPPALHFILGFIYTGTLIFSNRSYDLDTAFHIMRSATYLSLDTLYDEVQARIVVEMMHGLFHAFLDFAEYERVTGGRWGVGGCRCRQCARRVPRVLEFALLDDVKNQHLERGARRALVGLFGEGWCHPEFAGLDKKVREMALKGVAKRTTPSNVFALLFAAEFALRRLESVIDTWADVVKDMIVEARKGMDRVLNDQAEECFQEAEWEELMEADGVRFEDGEKVELITDALRRGFNEKSAAMVYQVLVSSILLRPHATDPNQTMLSQTSHVRVLIEQVRMDVVRWVRKRWFSIRNDGGFNTLENWALKELAHEMGVPSEDLRNLPAGDSPAKGSPPRTGGVRTAAGRPDTDGESMSLHSLRTSVLNRNMAKTNGPSSSNREPVTSSANSVRSVARSNYSTSSRVSTATTASRRTASASLRPDSKLTPSRSPSRATSHSSISISEEASPASPESVTTSSSSTNTPRSSIAFSRNVPADDPPTPTPTARPKSSAASISSVRSHASTIRKTSTPSTSTKGSPSLRVPSTSTRPPSSVSNYSTADGSASATYKTAKSDLASAPGARTRRASVSSAVSSVSVKTTASGKAAAAGSSTAAGRPRRPSAGSAMSTTLSTAAKAKKPAGSPETGTKQRTTSGGVGRPPSAASLRSPSAASLRSNAASVRSTATSPTTPRKVSARPKPPSESPNLKTPTKPAASSSGPSGTIKASRGKTVPPVPVVPRTASPSAKSEASTPTTAKPEHTAKPSPVNAVKESVTRRASTDTITKSTVGGSAITNPPPPAASLPTFGHSVAGAPRGATLEVGIPCIISSKRARFRAFARYIGEVEGESGPWVGVEVPLMDNGTTEKVEKRQWNDGTWGGIKYFDLGVGAEWDYSEERAARRRRLDQWSGGSTLKGSSILGLKREAELSVDGRSKRFRAASPAVSDVTNTTESRGLFVRPQQVLYVVDAVGADF